MHIDRSSNGSEPATADPSDGDKATVGQTLLAGCSMEDLPDYSILLCTTYQINNY